MVRVVVLGIIGRRFESYSPENYYMGDKPYKIKTKINQIEKGFEKRYFFFRKSPPGGMVNTEDLKSLHYRFESGGG